MNKPNFYHYACMHMYIANSHWQMDTGVKLQKNLVIQKNTNIALQLKRAKNKIDNDWI